MAKDDNYLKEWLSDPHRFVDLYNGGLFNGQQVFSADKVTPVRNEAGLVIKDLDGTETPIQRYRDIVMQIEQGPLLMVMACENQKEIHYAMPVRGMLYDALHYTAQVRRKAKDHRAQKGLHGAAEFLSGITKEDRLVPCLPLVFYYGENEWDGSKDLYGLLNIPEEEKSLLEKFLPNYKINLIDANRLSRELNQKNCFQSDLQWILGMLKYKNNKNELVNYIYKYEKYFRQIDEHSYNAAKVLLGSEQQLKQTLQLKEEGGKIDMCKALEELYQDGLDTGIETGIKTGIEKGIEALILDNLEDGKDELAILAKLQKRFSLSKEDAIQYLRKYYKKD